MKMKKLSIFSFIHPSTILVAALCDSSLSSFLYRPRPRSYTYVDHSVVLPPSATGVHHFPGYPSRPSISFQTISTLSFPLSSLCPFFPSIFPPFVPLPTPGNGIIYRWSSLWGMRQQAMREINSD